MTNTLVHNRSNTSSSSELRFVSSPSQSKRSASIDVPTATRSVSTYVQTLSGPLMVGWTLREPITLTVEPDGESFIASESITTVFGYGDSGPEAVRDYIVSLCEYYQVLEAANTIEAYQALARLSRYLIKKHN